MTVSFVPARVPLVDPRTGIVTREWYLLFQGLFDVGDGEIVTEDDIISDVPLPSFDPRTSDLQAEQVALWTPPGADWRDIDETRVAAADQVVFGPPLVSLGRRVEDIEAATAEGFAQILSFMGLANGPTPVVRGGTGAITLTAGYLLKGNGTSPVTASIAYDTGNSVLFGTTSATGISDGSSTNPGVQIDNSGSIFGQRNNFPVLWLSKITGAANNTFATFSQAGANVGSITVTGGTTTNYNTTSDETLKIDDGELSAEDARAVLALIRIHNFRWKANDQADVGVFAQELHKVYPAAVTPGGWMCMKTGLMHARKTPTRRYVPWSVDYSKLIPVVVRVMQDHEDRLQRLEKNNEVMR